jgi:hypothetical protein
MMLPVRLQLCLINQLSLIVPRLARFELERSTEETGVETREGELLPIAGLRRLARWLAFPRDPQLLHAD